MEHKTWWKCITYPERIDYVSFQNNEYVFVGAIEKLLELEVPPKATWMRTLLCELNRIHSHLVWLGTTRAGAGCDLDVLVRVPRARADPRPVRARDRVSHAHAVLPGRRARRGHPARLLSRGAQVLRLDAASGRRLRDAAHPQQDLARAHGGARAALGGGRDRARPVRPGAARLRRRLGPAEERAVPRLRHGRLRRPRLPGGRRLRALPRAHGRDARVGAHRRAVPRPARADGGRAVDRGRPQGRAAAAARAAHVDGVAHPPLQDRHRRLPRPRGRGVLRDRVAARRARLLHLLGRRPEAVAREVPRAVVRRAARRRRR